MVTRRLVARVKLLEVPQDRFDFLIFEELSRLVEATRDDPEPLALVLLGAEAGLRQGARRSRSSRATWIRWLGR